MNQNKKNLVRFDNKEEEVTFEPTLLELGEIKERKVGNNKFQSIDITYNKLNLQIKLPKAELNGINYNKELKSYSLAYPQNEESFEFNAWINKFEECIKSKLPKYNLSPIFRDSKCGKTLYINFASANGKLNQECFGFDKAKKDIKSCIDTFGDYSVIVDIPSIYISTTAKKIQIYGFAVIVDHKAKPETDISYIF